MSFERELRGEDEGRWQSTERDTLKSFRKVHSIKLNLFSGGMEI